MTMLSFPTVCAYALPEIIPLQVSYTDPSYDQEDQNRSPELIPSVSIDDHTLFFETPCDGCLLRIIDEDNYVVYSVVIPVGATMHVLPTYLSGDYEIQIIHDNLCFYGYIEL